MRKCGERKWGNGWRKIPVLHYGAIIRLHTYDYYCRFMAGYSVYIGTASTLYCRRAKKLKIKKNKKVGTCIDAPTVSFRFSSENVLT